jgi:hypothetical protein
MKTQSDAWAPLALRLPFAQRGHSKTDAHRGGRLGLAKITAILLEFTATVNTLDQWNWSAQDVAETFELPEVAE